MSASCRYEARQWVRHTRGQLAQRLGSGNWGPGSVEQFCPQNHGHHGLFQCFQLVFVSHIEHPFTGIKPMSVANGFRNYLPTCCDIDALWCTRPYPPIYPNIHFELQLHQAPTPATPHLHHCTGVVHQQSRDTRLFHHLHALFAGQHIVWVEARAASRIVRATAV